MSNFLFKQTLWHGSNHQYEKNTSNHERKYVYTKKTIFPVHRIRNPQQYFNYLYLVFVFRIIFLLAECTAPETDVSELMYMLVHNLQAYWLLDVSWDRFSLFAQNTHIHTKLSGVRLFTGASESAHIKIHTKKY